MAGLVVAAPSEAAGVRLVEFTGHGWGHGRGMGQWGAYGYATDHGWTSAQILDHFYGGTTSGTVPGDAPVDPDAIRVDLRYMHDVPTTVALGAGTIVLRAPDGTELGRVTTGAARLRWVGSAFEVDTAATCDGPWTTQQTTGAATVRLVAETSASDRDGLLEVCGPEHQSWYEGEVWAAVDEGQQRTVNTLPVERHLRGVVPREVPASWPAAALEAQAVAARSYALAGDTRQQPYADTCDTTACQVYEGVFTTQGGTLRTVVDSRTDAAITATAGTVRLTGGTVARTEFSSSTGGWSAGGTFPAVVDDGDDTAANPHHDWTATVDMTPVETTYDMGRLLAIDVVARNGLGQDGGRVLAVELRFVDGTVRASGTTIRTLLGLKSDWFTPGPVVDTDKLNTAEGWYVDRMYRVLVGRAATDAEVTRWFDVVQGGDRLAMTSTLVRSDHFIGLLVDDLYMRALGRPPDAEGRAYWIGQIAGGVTVESVGVLFFGSPEYYARSGGTDTSFVTALYRDILGREPDPGGLAYWVDRLDTGRANLDDVAAGFYGSLESRRARAVALYALVLDSTPADSSRDAVAERLLTIDDLPAAAEVAALPLATYEATYVDRMYRVLVGRAATDAEVTRWFDVVQGGDRLAMTSTLVRSDHFIGLLVDDLYMRALGRPPDAEGRAYWIGQIAGGVTVESVGVLFFGSPEYYARSGGTDTSFVTALYRDILGREPDPGGLAYWVDRLDTGTANLDDVAAGFYGSLESRRARAVALYALVLDSTPADSSRDAVAERLLTIDDLPAAAEVAASDDAFGPFI